MKFIFPLCSSSKGNCCYIGDNDTGIIVDSGVGIRNFERLLAMHKINPYKIQGLFVTHAHTDHISGLKNITAKYNIPVYASIGTIDILLEKNLFKKDAVVKEIQKSTKYVGDFEINAFATPHDINGSQCYHINYANTKIAICTDLGHITAEVEQNLFNSDICLLESNYDEHMLDFSDYPAVIKNRIKGKYGHLSNDDCASFLVKMLKHNINNFVLGHLSENNNTVNKAVQTAVIQLELAGATLGQEYNLNVAPVKSNGEIIIIQD